MAKEKEVTYAWDGEKLKQTKTTQEKKHTPKDVIQTLDQARNQINQLNASKSKALQQIGAIERDLENVKVFLKDLTVFEEQAVKFQRDRLQLLIRQVSSECAKKARESSKATIEKDPNAYNETQKKSLPYLDYQKNLATHPKIAERISRRIITQDLYEKPVFDNPFN